MKLQRLNYHPNRTYKAKKLGSFSEVPPSSPWWVILLKVLAYAIGLVLAGYGTTAAAQTIFIH